MDRRLLVLAAEQAGPPVYLLQRGGVLVEFAGIGRAEQSRIDDGHFPHAAQGTFELETAPFSELADPAAVGFLGQRIEPACDVGRRRLGLLRVAEDSGIE